MIISARCLHRSSLFSVILMGPLKSMGPEVIIFPCPPNPLGGPVHSLFFCRMLSKYKSKLPLLFYHHYFFLLVFTIIVVTVFNDYIKLVLSCLGYKDGAKFLSERKIHKIQCLLIAIVFGKTLNLTLSQIYIAILPALVLLCT